LSARWCRCRPSSSKCASMICRVSSSSDWTSCPTVAMNLTNESSEKLNCLLSSESHRLSAERVEWEWVCITIAVSLNFFPSFHFQKQWITVRCTIRRGESDAICLSAFGFLWPEIDLFESEFSMNRSNQSKNPSKNQKTLHYFRKWTEQTHNSIESDALNLMVVFALKS
jgi:hypothetical protein